MATVKKSAPKKSARKVPVKKDDVKKGLHHDVVFPEPSLQERIGKEVARESLKSKLRIPPNPIPPYEGQKTPAHSEYDRDAGFLESAMYELKNLRQQNNHMATRLEMFDKMYALFSTGNRSGGDMCCQQPLEERIEKRLYEKAEDRKVSK